MLRHVVMVKAKDSFSYSEKAEKLNQFKNSLEDLKGKINELNYLEVGMNMNTKPSAYDLILITEFDSETALDLYRVHPDHLKVLDLLKELAGNVAVVDYFTTKKQD